jgi:Integral membrane protein CcmA involved in cell shape determination
MSDPDLAAATTPLKRRFLDRSTSTPTLVGKGSRFEGNFACPGDVSVAGEVVGHGEIKGMLTLSESGSWQGAVQCADALVAGLFEGELWVNRKLEVRASARLRGKISATHIAVAEGAIIEADIIVTSGAPIERFAERRHG